MQQKLPCLLPHSYTPESFAICHFVILDVLEGEKRVVPSILESKRRRATMATSHLGLEFFNDTDF